MFSQKCFKLLKCRLLAPLTEASTEKGIWSYLKRGFEKYVVNKSWNWILNKELRIHGRKIHQWFLKAVVSLAHKAFEISWIPECWQRALMLFLATTLSLFQAIGLQQLLLDKAVLICTLHTFNKKRLDLEEKILCQDCIIMCRGACMYMD